MAKIRKLETAATAAMLVVDHLEQLAGIGLDLRSPRHHDADALCNRAVARLERLCSDLVELRQALSIGAVRDSLRHGYPDVVVWCDVEGRCYCEVVFKLGLQLYTTIVMQCPDVPPDAALDDPLQPIDGADLRAVWSRVAAHVETFGRQVPWRDVEKLRNRVAAECDRAVVVEDTGPKPGTCESDYVGAKDLRDGKHGACRHEGETHKRLVVFLKRHADRIHTYLIGKRLMIHIEEYRTACRTSSPQVTPEDIKMIVQEAIDQETTKGGIRQTTAGNGQVPPDSIHTLDLSRPVCDVLLNAGIAVLDDLDALSEGQLRVIDGITDGMIAEITAKGALRNDR